ncbi:MAG TPA: GWxTD domain-containing protein [Terriglobales bacterium]|nr:GWxTD domain-containing protein [Terriglobales bacterium]
MDRFRALPVVLLLALWSVAGAPVLGQENTPENKDAKASTSGKNSTEQEADPLKRPLSEKQRKEQEKSLRKELGKTYKRWLDEDVRWIIMDEEMQAFKQFSNDEERDSFIEQFWLRRDPTPDTIENEYKEEHYRRMAYANERFAAGKPGWKTDRGRIYVIFGPPDQIDAHPSGGLYQRPMEEGGGSTSTYPFEVWRYRYLDLPGAGQQEVEIEFVDTCMCGDYHMTIDRSEKDALLYVPNAGPTWFEEMGLASKTDRFTRGGMERLGVGPFNRNLVTSQFDRLELYGKLQKPPQIKFKELEEVVTSKVRYNLMPFDVRVDFVRITTDTVMVPVTIQLKNRDLTFVNKEGVQRGVANIFGRLTTLTGRIAQTFEDTVQVDVPEALLSKTILNASVYWKAMPLRPGRYRLDIVVKDVNGDRVGTWSRGLLVPSFDEDKLAASTLIVADQMEKVPTRQVGSGNFVIGTTKVRPRVEPADGKPVSFKRSANDRVNFWMQVYNLSVDEKTQKPSATIEYDLVNVLNKQSLMKQVESTDQLGNVGEQVTLEKSLPIENLPPGTYQLTIKVNDNLSKQTISPTAKFSVE